MDRPRDLVMGPYGELIAADTGNVRIVRFHPDGTLIEIIGREGAGPGEFRAPRGLAIQRDEPVLWAGDEFHRRISRFRLTEEASEFIDSPIYPLATGVFSPDFAAEDRLAVWAVTVGRDRRITSMTAEGKVYTAFGRPFEPHRELVSERSLNQGYLLLGEHALTFVGAFKPVIERWTLDGQLLVTAPFPFPETEETLERERSLPPDRMPVYAEGVGHDRADERLYLLIRRRRIYELDAATLEIERRFEWAGEDGWWEAMVVEDTGQEIRFFLLDGQSGSVLRLSTE